MRVTRLNQALLVVTVALGVITAASTSHAATYNDPTPFDSSAYEPRKRVRFVLNVPAVFVLPGGSSFDGQHASVVQPDHVVHLPKLSGGVGVRPGVGVFVKHLFEPISGMLLLDFEWSRHAAKGYNAGDVAYSREYSTLTNVSLEMRAILDTMQVKPFLALAPGYGWVTLPRGVTIIDPSTRNTSWADVTLRGASVAISAGASYPFTEWLAAEASIGVRFHSYTSSTLGTVSGLGLNAGFLGALGLTLML